MLSSGRPRVLDLVNANTLVHVAQIACKVNALSMPTRRGQDQPCVGAKLPSEMRPLRLPTTLRRLYGAALAGAAKPETEPMSEVPWMDLVGSLAFGANRDLVTWIPKQRKHEKANGPTWLNMAQQGQWPNKAQREKATGQRPMAQHGFEQFRNSGSIRQDTGQLLRGRQMQGQAPSKSAAWASPGQKEDASSRQAGSPPGTKAMCPPQNVHRPQAKG